MLFQGYKVLVGQNKKVERMGGRGGGVEVVGGHTTN